MTSVEPESLLKAMFAAAVATSQPARALPPFLSSLPHGRLIVLGAGKAAAAMAQAVEDHWSGPLEGLVVTRHGHAVACRHIEVIEAAHPVPDATSHAAAQRMLQRAQAATSDDTVLFLFSGGGSALLSLPLPGITQADKQAVHRTLLASGATITEMNCLRRHLSAIKGGRLAAAAYPARCVNLLISDVPGDQPWDIASGPTVADPSTRADALAIAERYRLMLPPSVRAILDSPDSETLKPGDPRLRSSENHLIATPQAALEAAAQVAHQHGVNCHILGSAIEGEAREVARTLAGITRQVAEYNQPFQPPCILLSGGETTVTLQPRAGASGCSESRGAGHTARRGGRNVEFLLALGLALDSRPKIWALAADTDGVDGTDEAAGAILRSDTLQRACELGLDPRQALERHDAHAFFEALGDRIVTGPTLTNVNDFRAIFVGF